MFLVPSSVLDRLSFDRNQKQLHCIDHKGNYLDSYQKLNQDTEKAKDIDFELIYTDQINVAYILKLFVQLKGEKRQLQFQPQRNPLFIIWEDTFN